MGTNFYYTILGVQPDASKDEIEKQYRKLIKQYHPDGGVSNANMFKLLTEARETLLDDEKRQLYDEQQKLAEGTQYSNEGVQYSDDDLYDDNLYDYDKNDTSKSKGYRWSWRSSLFERFRCKSWAQGTRYFLDWVDDAQMAILQLVMVLICMWMYLGAEVFDVKNINLSLYCILIISVVFIILVKNLHNAVSALFLILKFAAIAILATVVAGIIISILPLYIKTKSIVSAFVLSCTPFIFLVLDLIKVFKLVRISKKINPIRKFTTYVGFVCSILLVVLCAANIPILTSYVYEDESHTEIVLKASEEKAEYLKDISKRDCPTTLPSDISIIESGAVSRNCAIKSLTTYTVIENHAKKQIEADIYLYLFEYMIKDDATDYMNYVGEIKFAKNKDLYEYCVIRYVRMNNIDSSLYESMQSDNNHIGLKIVPQNKEYEKGYYIGKTAVKAEVGIHNFSSSDGYIGIKVPKGYYEYNLIINLANGEDCIVNMNECFN